MTDVLEIQQQSMMRCKSSRWHSRAILEELHRLHYTSPTWEDLFFSSSFCICHLRDRIATDRPLTLTVGRAAAWFASTVTATDVKAWPRITHRGGLVGRETTTRTAAPREGKSSGR